jgi:short-subunit dehydrogenase
MNLRQAHVLIVGGSKGVGAALAGEVVSRGARLTLLARPSPELDEVAARTGGAALAVDLSDHGALHGLIARAEAANGPVDVIVNNAAMTTGGPFQALTAEQLRASVMTNLISHMELDRQVLGGMIERGRGVVQVVGSLSAEVSMIRLAAYAPAKAGLAKFGIDLQREVKDLGIGVQVFVLGSIPGTQIARSVVGDPVIRFIERRTGAIGALTPERVARVMADHLERGRSCVRTLPAMAGWITQARLVPVRVIDPLMSRPARAEARRLRGA